MWHYGSSSLRFSFRNETCTMPRLSSLIKCMYKIWKYKGNARIFYNNLFMIGIYHASVLKRSVPGSTWQRSSCIVIVIINTTFDLHGWQNKSMKHKISKFYNEYKHIPSPVSIPIMSGLVVPNWFCDTKVEQANTDPGGKQHREIRRVSKLGFFVRFT